MVDQVGDLYLIEPSQGQARHFKKELEEVVERNDEDPL